MDEPPPKKLRTISFAVHATRGLIRDQSMRRKTMFVLLLAALLLLFSGFTFLAPVLDPRRHLGWTLLFWFACLWLTLTAMFLALFDMLMIRVQGRKAQRMFKEELSGTPGSPSRRDGE